MRFSYSLHPDRKLALLNFSGSLSIADISRAAHQFWSDPAYNREYDGIADLQNVTTRLKIKDIKSLIDFLQKPQVGTGRWVAIVNSPKATALTLIFKVALTGPFQFEVVSTWEAACRFLDIPDPDRIARI